EARDLRFEASETVERIREAGADYQPPLDLEARILAAIDAGTSESSGSASSASDAAPPGRTTSPGFGSPELDALRRQDPGAVVAEPVLATPPDATSSTGADPRVPETRAWSAPASAPLGADPSAPPTGG